MSTTNPNNSEVSSSPETQPADSPLKRDQENITHQGSKAAPAREGQDVQSYMGALEDNVTPVMPPMDSSSIVTQPSNEPEDIKPRSELTPG